MSSTDNTTPIQDTVSIQEFNSRRLIFTNWNNNAVQCMCRVTFNKSTQIYPDVISAYITTGELPKIKYIGNGITRYSTNHVNYSWSLQSYRGTYLNNTSLVATHSLVIASDMKCLSSPLLIAISNDLYGKLVFRDGSEIYKQCLSLVSSSWILINNYETPDVGELLTYNTDIVVLEYATDYWTTRMLNTTSNSIMTRLSNSIIKRSMLVLPRTHIIANINKHGMQHILVPRGFFDYKYANIDMSKRTYYEVIIYDGVKLYLDYDNVDPNKVKEYIDEVISHIIFAFKKSFDEVLLKKNIIIMRSFPNKQLEDGTTKASFHIIVNSLKRFKNNAIVRAFLEKYNFLNGRPNTPSLKADKKVYKSYQKFRIIESNKVPTDNRKDDRYFKFVSGDYEMPIDTEYYFKINKIGYLDTLISDPSYEGEYYDTTTFSERIITNNNFDEKIITDDEFNKIVDTMGIRKVWDSTISQFGGIEMLENGTNDIEFPHVVNLRTKLVTEDGEEYGEQTLAEDEYENTEEIIIKLPRWLDSDARRKLVRLLRRTENSVRMYYLFKIFMELITRKNDNHSTLMDNEGYILIESDPTDTLSLWLEATAPDISIGRYSYEPTKLLKWLNKKWIDGIEINDDKYTYTAIINTSTNYFIPHVFSYNKYNGAVINARYVEGYILVDIYVYNMDRKGTANITIYPVHELSENNNYKSNTPVHENIIHMNDAMNIKLNYGVRTCVIPETNYDNDNVIKELPNEFVDKAHPRVLKQYDDYKLLVSYAIHISVNE
jgi:hypothetical protein